MKNDEDKGGLQLHILCTKLHEYHTYNLEVFKGGWTTNEWTW